MYSLKKISKFLIIFVAGLTFSTNAQGVNVDDVKSSLMSQIQQLQAQILELQQKIQALQVAESQKPSTSEVDGFWRDFAEGEKGDDVKVLQEFLYNEGVYPDGLFTGYFGPLTRAAVVRFQEKYSDEILKPIGLANGTGFFGPRTRQKVNSILISSDGGNNRSLMFGISEEERFKGTLDNVQYDVPSQTLRITGACNFPQIYFDGIPAEANGLAVYIYATGDGKTTGDFYYPDISRGIFTPVFLCVGGKYDVTVPLKELLSESWGSPGPFATTFPPHHEYGTEFGVEVEPILFDADSGSVAEGMGINFGPQFVISRN